MTKKRNAVKVTLFFVERSNRKNSEGKNVTDRVTNIFYSYFFIYLKGQCHNILTPIFWLNRLTGCTKKISFCEDFQSLRQQLPYCLPTVSLMPHSILSTHFLPTVSQLSPNCLPTVSHLSPFCLPSVSLLSPHCLPTVSPL